MINMTLNKHYSTSASTRKRTHLKPSQVAVLQETFVTNTLPDATLRCQLAQELGVGERTIQIWFQNRRAKARKLEAATPDSTLVPNVRTGWIDIPQPINHKQKQAKQHAPTTTYQAKTSVKRRPRSCSKPEKTNNNLLLTTLPQRAMSEGMGRAESTSPSQDNAKPIVSFPVQTIRIGTWARFAKQINGSSEWDLVCFSDPSSSQLIWQVQDCGHQFRIEVGHQYIKQIRLGQIQQDVGQLDIDVEPNSNISFSMRRYCIDQDWVRCNDFTENQQASNTEAGSHALQGSHDNLRQSLLELISQAPHLASKLVILPDNNLLCRDLTVSPSATPEPVTAHYMPSSSWMLDPAKSPWAPYAQPQSYDASTSWPYLSMLQQQSQQTSHHQQQHQNQQQHSQQQQQHHLLNSNDMVLNPFI